MYHSFISSYVCSFIYSFINVSMHVFIYLHVHIFATLVYVYLCVRSRVHLWWPRVSGHNIKVNLQSTVTNRYFEHTPGCVWRLTLMLHLKRSRSSKSNSASYRRAWNLRPLSSSCAEYDDDEMDDMLGLSTHMLLHPYIIRVCELFHKSLKDMCKTKLSFVDTIWNRLPSTPWVTMTHKTPPGWPCRKKSSGWPSHTKHPLGVDL